MIIRAKSISTGVACAVACAVAVACARHAPSPLTIHADAPSGFGPGQRVLLDAHNAYPERGKWDDRIARALTTGLPIAIEQDLYWHRSERTGAMDIVVAHDDDALAGAPTLDEYFFRTLRPVMEKALLDNDRSAWPLVTLNLDFKTNEPAHHEAVWALLGKYEAWLTTAERTATPDITSPFRVGPMLVLTGQDSTQRINFHDRVPVGERLRVFGAAPVPAPAGLTREARTRAQVRALPRMLMPAPASNYVRWVNFAWLAVEEGGAARGRDWTAGDRARLFALVERAHQQRLWIRFYTLDGFALDDPHGYTPSYNFGDVARAALRWRSVIAAGVDFVATDQYEEFARVRGQHRK